MFCVALSGCANEGSPPPLGRIYFPTALSISPDNSMERGQLFVANSNFDLKYNRGSLQSYDLQRLNEVLDEHCGSRTREERDRCGVIPEEDPRPDLTGAIDLRRVSGLLISEVIIGSYANGMGVSRMGTEGGRIYMPVRSDANLTFVDVDAEGCLSCGGDTNACDLNEAQRHECTDAFRSGDDESATVRGIELPADPVAVTVGPVADLVSFDAPGSYVLMAHRGGRVSLFLDALDGVSVTPRLVHTLEGLPTELVTLNVDPRSRTAWIPNAIEPIVSRVGVAIDDDLGALDRSFLYDAGNLRLAGIDTGPVAGFGDTREVEFDPRPDVRRAYILSRLPRALLTVDTDESLDAAEIVDIVEVGNGPSRLQVEHFDASDRTLAFISCFDSRDLYVVDVDAARLVGIVRGLGGPFELAVDVVRNRLYLTDFAQSVIRVLDLQPMFDCLEDEEFGAVTRECTPAPLGFIGRPRPVQELI